jgi:hypothetical protein
MQWNLWGSGRKWKESLRWRGKVFPLTRLIDWLSDEENKESRDPPNPNPTSQDPQWFRAINRKIKPIPSLSPPTTPNSRIFYALKSHSSLFSSTSMRTPDFTFIISRFHQLPLLGLSALTIQGNYFVAKRQEKVIYGPSKLLFELRIERIISLALVQSRCFLQKVLLNFQLEQSSRTIHIT